MPAAKSAFPVLQRDHPLAQGLLLCLPFGEGSGPTANDLSGRNVNGAITTGPSWSAGQGGYALSFPGNSASGQGVVDCGNAAALDALTPVSLVASFYANSSLGDATWQQVAGKGSVFEGAGYLLVYNGNDLRFYIMTAVGNAFQFAAHVGLGKNQWVVAVGTYDGATIRIYTNGVLRGSTAVADTVKSYAAGFGVGRGGVNIAGGYRDTDRFGGLADMVAVYGRTLQAADAQALYADPWAMLRPDAGGWWLRAAAPASNGLLMRRRRFLAR